MTLLKGERRNCYLPCSWLPLLTPPLYDKSINRLTMFLAVLAQLAWGTAKDVSSNAASAKGTSFDKLSIQRSFCAISLFLFCLKIKPWVKLVAAIGKCKYFPKTYENKSYSSLPVICCPFLSCTKSIYKESYLTIKAVWKWRQWLRIW